MALAIWSFAAPPKDSMGYGRQVGGDVRQDLSILRIPIAVAVIAMVGVACSGDVSTTSSVPASTAQPTAMTTSSTAAEQSGDLPSGPRPVILDYSPTVSDVGALLYLLSHPDVEVLAVTLPATGEAGCDLGVDVTLGVLDLLERPKVPVACGPEPGHAIERWPESFLEGHGALASGLRFSGQAPDPRPGPQLLADIALGSDQPVTLVAVGPLTNVALALDQSELETNIERIVIMGGAVDVAGNVFDSDAEWNLWIDVPSAARVFDSDVPITLVPLDATNDVPVPSLWALDFAGAEQSPQIAYLGRLVGLFPAVTSGFFFLWDELAAAAAVDDGLVTFETRNLAVSEQSGAAYGSTVDDPSGRAIEVATGVSDTDEFYGLFLSTLAGAPVTRISQSMAVIPTGQPMPGPSSSADVVLAYWLENALRGDSEAANRAVAEGASQREFADSFVDGSGALGAFDITLTCAHAGSLAVCSAMWNDLWLEPNPDIPFGELQVEAEAVDGVIVAFQSLSFGEEIFGAFDSHLSWLERENPELAATCFSDALASACSQALVDTVDDWLASR